MTNKFETRYFYIESSYDEKFIKWNTVEGIISDDILEKYDIITSLMIQDIRGKFGEEYDVWEITKNEFEEKSKPSTD
ncbi:hypothetical protein AWH56_002755 [Anaerobacillus isosaccharinicus]|uniref:Uncharacterized protein n=1 Tax=Anaerobacillus isosaccharinicus TaxID=1532552 RepID=A0A1S2M9Y4_9BACI|nr:hypothetical protein [Anaerobacillus isosaccharinicus]MBA5585036.1 hypothetical protein [Anaerobacillus isosaccharinicus]QOY36613.1 hypothetical protein AWH56_002755 [Anaerobacillus isosaccharinicus]